jgi:hypothetical protein
MHSNTMFTQLIVVDEKTLVLNNEVRKVVIDET